MHGKLANQIDEQKMEINLLKQRLNDVESQKEGQGG